MLRRFLVPVLAVAVTVTACDTGVTGVESAAYADDYALVMFGEAGSALEGTMGTQSGPRPFDGRTGRRELPDSLKLTEEQKAEIAALREAFRTEHAAELEALKAIFEEARAARDAGATREEIHAILAQGREIREALREDVRALHEAIRAVLTPEQLAWLEANRPFPRPRPRPFGPR